jgi:phosphatidylinositol alpha-1,6-mannosyltransferase
MARARILIITRNFPPLMGGMERLNWHMAQELARRAEVRVIAPKGASNEAPSGVKVIEIPLRPLWLFLLTAGWQALVQAIAFRPHTVLAGSGLTAPFALISARFARAEAVAYVHGLDLAVPHALYRRLWLPAIRRLDRVIANSRSTVGLAQHVGVPVERIAIVHPGVELPDLDSNERISIRQAFRAQHSLGERPILLSVGRLTTRKGLIPFVREILPELVKAKPDLCLLIVGDAPKDALAAEAEPPAAILATAQKAGVSDNLRWIGSLFGNDLSAAYFAADVHVFPVREIPNDPEGFGMVAIEAAAHGLPTVAYATGGVVDAVSEGLSGLLVKPGDSAGFTAAVDQLLRSPLPAGEEQRFAQEFAWNRFGAKLASALASCEQKHGKF